MNTIEPKSSPGLRRPKEQPSTDATDGSTPKKHRRSRYDPEPDWSARMREVVSTSQRRIGYACDRCKLKKMKCTPETNGCASCRVLNLTCRVTDRVTGETHVRGAVGKMMLRIDRLTKTNEDLKRANEQLMEQNALQKRNYDLLETEYYLLRSEYISVRDELHHTNHPYMDDDAFAGEDGLVTTELPQQHGVL